ncbi:MAG: DPP IV N-terminal domain-containing protein [Acidobacteriia bacterium]|nr:DPP IV N-terminal domain-containing protein [Terriglobia bacterium]
MRRLVALLVFMAAPLIGGQQPLTIERIVADPPVEGVLPREVCWLPDGASFSFLETSGEGKDAQSTLWLEDATSGARHRLVADAELPAFGEGKDAVSPKLGGYRWSPKGDALLLAGGGDLFLVTIPGNQVRRLTATASEEELAEFSPDGRWVSFVRDNDLWSVKLTTGKEVRLTDTGSPDRINGKLDWVYQEELSGRNPTGYAWSPDSRWVACLSLDETRVPKHPIVDRLETHPATTEQRYPQPGDPNPVVGLSVIGVEAAQGARADRDHVWAGGTAEYVPRFGWTPESSAVWYQLLDRPQTRLELVREDVVTGKAVTLLVEKDAAWINLHDDEHFFRDGSLLWSTEAGGFRHLVLYAADGTSHTVTSGGWEITSVAAVDEPGGWIYFTGNEAGPLETQLYRVRPDGSGFGRLTREPGAHRVEVAPGARFILDTVSDASHAPTMRVLDKEGRVLRTVAAVRPSSLGEYVLGTTEFLTVTGPGGTAFEASLLKPAGFDPARRYPVVVYVYGGPHAQVVRNGWGRQTQMFHQVLASRGFLVFSLDNRGSAARGREFERALLDRLGKVELEDQLAGVEYLKTLPYVDASRIGIWGWSYGGFMTCYALTNAPGVFKAGAAVAPVTDWRLYDSIYTERYLKLPAGNEAGYRESSPVNRADKLADALLLLHGTGDDNVHWGNTLAFVDRLYKAGKPYDLQLYPNKNHSILGKDARAHLYNRIAAHFERWLLH